MLRLHERSGGALRTPWCESVNRGLTALTVDVFRPRRGSQGMWGSVTWVGALIRHSAARDRVAPGTVHRVRRPVRQTGTSRRPSHGRPCAIASLLPTRVLRLVVEGEFAQ